jgi:ribosomal protein L7/L12
VTGDLTTRLRELVAAGKAVLAIRELRRETGMGLREAKEYVDALAVTGEPPAPPPGEVGEVGEVGEQTLARARELAAAGRVVHAVKAVRDETGWDLRRCKDVVDRMPKKRRGDGSEGYFRGLNQALFRP